ncbi:ATP-binding protein [Streptomyces sp. cg28]|uniref:ATP-binding protein n=1 Tax=Streptomyces sp. cg28 TaxID=3403457 RepID=UPI003B22678E
MSAPEMPFMERMTSSEARAHTRAALIPLCDSLPPDRARRLLEDALLVVSELVGNALNHGGGVNHFCTREQDGEFVVEIGDRSSVPPRTIPYDPSVPGGFGWLMVHSLSRSVTVRHHEEGKIIIAVLDGVSYS